MRISAGDKYLIKLLAVGILENRERRIKLKI
jgi:hypothetical protein